MKTQTAVEFLESHLIEYGFDLSLHKIEIEQAKEMEKQQIIEAWIADDNELQRLSAEQYYNETFKK
jgi:hypothetical protein